VGVKFLITGQTVCRYNYQEFLFLVYETAAFWIAKNITSTSPLLVLYPTSIRLPITFSRVQRRKQLGFFFHFNRCACQQKRNVNPCLSVDIFATGSLSPAVGAVTGVEFRTSRRRVVVLLNKSVLEEVLEKLYASNFPHRRRILLEKQQFISHLKKFPEFYGTGKFRNVFKKSPTLIPIFSLTNPVRNLASCFFNIRFNSIFSCPKETNQEKKCSQAIL
jgi:hypothetical protein